MTDHQNCYLLPAAQLSPLLLLSKHMPSYYFFLSQVTIHAGFVFVTLQVLSINQSLNATLDTFWLWTKKLKLLEYFSDEIRVTQLLSRLHDSNNGCLNCDCPVILHSFRIMTRLQTRHRNSQLSTVVAKFNCSFETITRTNFFTFGSFFVTLCTCRRRVSGAPSS